MGEWNMKEKIVNIDLTNVAVFIDYENIHKTLVKNNRNAIRDGFFDKIREWFKDVNRRIVKIAVYCNFDNEDLYESHHQTLLQSYGVETIHTSNQGKNFADLQLTIDVMNAMYLNDNIDEFIIMSNDKDMTPLLNNIRYNKRKAVVVTTGNLYNRTLCSFADEQIAYETIISKKVNSSIIEDLDNKIKENLFRFFDISLNDFISEKRNGQNAVFRDLGLDYFCNAQTKSCMLMKYEVYNCINHLKISDKVFFYTYIYRGSTFIAVAPSAKKDLLLNENIIIETDIVDYDIRAKVAQVYEEYRKKS